MEPFTLLIFSLISFLFNGILAIELYREKKLTKELADTSKDLTQELLDTTYNSINNQIEMLEEITNTLGGKNE